VKAANPYSGLNEGQLKIVQEGLEQGLKDPHSTPANLAIIQEKLQQVYAAQAALGVPAQAGQSTQSPASWASAGPPQGAPATALSGVAQWQQLIDIAEAAAPQLQQALMQAFTWEKLPASVHQHLLTGNHTAAMSDLVDFGMQQMAYDYVPAFAELTGKLFEQVAEAQWPAVRQVLLATKVPAELPTKLPEDLLSPRAQAYVRTEGLTRAKNLWAPTVEAGRAILRQGLAEGWTTPKIAKELRNILGLLPAQGKQLLAYNQSLMESDTPPAKVDVLTEKLANRLLRRRTMTIARTETNAALNVAADTFFQAAKHQANLPETALRRFWLITYDSRTCPICQAIPGMNPDGHLFDEPFQTPTGPKMRPPSHPNCRCVVIVRPTIIAAPQLTTPPGVPTPVTFPQPEPFPPPPPPAPVLQPPVPKPPKQPKAPKQPKVPPAQVEPPPPLVSESWDIHSPSPPWSTNPPQNFWMQTKDVDVGPLPALPTGKLSTGVVMIEHGKVWVYEPKNHFGGYSLAFPKGTLEQGLSPQQNALKEVFEETGLQAKVTGFVGDFTTTTGTTRLYLGERIGGNPTGFGGETWSVKLLSPADLEHGLLAQGQPYPLKVLKALQDQGLLPKTPGVAPAVSTGAFPTPAPVTAPAPPPPPELPKLPKVPHTIDADVVTGELVQALGGSTGAQLYRGTDGVLRVLKHPETQQAYQEFAANRLYRSLGIDAPEQQLVMKEGKIVGVAAPFLEGGQTLDKAGLTQARAQEVLKGFVADVWLANRDAVGLTMDNILVRGNQLTRIDNGGSLMYRAQGAKKPANQLTQLLEWEGFQKPHLNRAYAEVFQASGYGAPDAIPDLLGQVQKLQHLRAQSNNFLDLLPAAKGVTLKQRKEIAALLQKRATLLEEQVGLTEHDSSVAVATARLKQYLGYNYDSYARSVMQRKVPTDMHEYEAVSLYAYTGQHYHDMNKVFWNSRDPDKRAQERVQHAPLIDAALSALPKLERSQESERYYRGVREIKAAHLATHVKGGEIMLEGFASTSRNRDVALHTFGFGQYLYVIKSHGGSYDVRPLSAMGAKSREQEFLYPPDTKFRILDIVREPDVAHPVYYIEEIPQVDKHAPDRREVVDKADDVDTFVPDLWPPGHETWTHDEYVADARAMQAEAAAYTPSTEEREEMEHFMRKAESASGYNQADPNAD
jgi:8-oxo-dGTP pyrophosphatase MutT (NUDIX family)